MDAGISWTANRLRKAGGGAVSFLGAGEVGRARAFHRGFPEYRETPLIGLARLSERLGLGGIFVKDESFRFGLNAFKVLGCSWAMARIMRREDALGDGDPLPAAPVSPGIRDGRSGITFVTATDGNHGRGVAWTARRLGQKAVVYMPKGSSPFRLAQIRAEGAEAGIIEGNYDDAVRLAAENARRHGWIVVQDTAWEGYEEIPRWIMQGYGTIALEAREQMARLGIPEPTHILLQAGVGSFAGAIQGVMAETPGESGPRVAIVEPERANCLFRSALAGDGKPRIVGGEMDTIMAGLACGEPNPIAWEILRDHAVAFFSCPDSVAATGMRILGNPLGEDRRVISGESGAVTAGLLAALMRREELADAREFLALDDRSRVLLISTEGDTDPEMYRRIVWDGLYPGGGAPSI